MRQSYRIGRAAGRETEKRREKNVRQSVDGAGMVLRCGVIFVSLFFLLLYGKERFSLQRDMARDAAPPSDAVSVMALPENGAAETAETETRERLRDVAGDPFGYAGGEWNLWEYIGDVLAALLFGE